MQVHKLILVFIVYTCCVSDNIVMILSFWTDGPEQSEDPDQTAEDPDQTVSAQA